MTNINLEDVRRFIEWRLNEKTQFLKSRFHTNKKTGV